MFEVLPKSLIEFKNTILTESICSLKLNTHLDNFDAERFNFDGNDRSNFFDVRERTFYFCWFFENFQSLYHTYLLLCDEQSKRIYLSIICYRLAGHHSIKVLTSFSETSEELALYKAQEQGKRSDLVNKGQFGSLKHYDFQYNGYHYVIDCLGLKWYLLRKQYFYSQEGVCIQPEDGDYVIDGGACLGDTAVVFGKSVGPKGKVFAFDPVADHLEILSHNIAQNPDCKIESIPYGLSNTKVEASPVRLDSYSPGFNTSNKRVPLQTLDNLVDSGIVSRVDFIKLDIEGSELAALEGAMKTIIEFKPKLAISIYHNPGDLFLIPQFIRSHFNFYKFYLGHYTIHREESVLYCSPG
jgi:FkbM family methyltransferase